ncbi:LysR family transcriptional regulator [Kitasatospora sp. NPDC087861]|uniref:LysR family transcriptional regulator n=1 Tax=Kitasatospora sp. NPDC087861 TaxID=3364070 RepID=UPI00380E5198
MAVNLAQLRALVAVVDTGAFNAAASVLEVSQSAVSHALASLERTLGAPVVHRGAAPIRPTPLGAQLLPHARQAVSAVDAVLSLGAAHRAVPGGVVRVAAPPTVCRGLLPDLLTTWAQAHPHLKVRVFEGEDTEVARWLANGTADLAVLVDPDPVPDGALLLLHDEFRAALAGDHPLAHERSVTLRDLDDDPMLLSDGGCERYLRELHRLDGSVYVPPPRIRGFATLLDMVRAGVGVAVVPGLARCMLPAGTVLVPLRPTVHRRLLLSGPPKRPWGPAVQTLMASAASTGTAV